jgi:DNA invertase Pin-like site-specific DNA recombinase
MRLRIGYARVSTEEQADSLPPQIARLEAAGCDLVLSDIERGKNPDRQGLIEAMAMVRGGKASEIIVTRIDRLGRDAAFSDQLLGLAQGMGVVVRALDGGIIETLSPQGFLMARLTTGLAEMESRMLSLRIRKQFEQYRAQGRHLRRRLPFGYARGDGVHLVPHPENWAHALRVLGDLRRLGSFAAVAYHLPNWCTWTPAGNSLQAWFTNPVIRGHIGHLLDKSSGKGWNRRWAEIHYDQHPALISEVDWRELADLLQRTRNRYAKVATLESSHGLTGLLVCSSCGHRLRRNTAQGVAWWRCRHRLCSERGGVKETVVMPVVIKACVESAETLARAAAAPVDDDPALIMKRRDLDATRVLASRNPYLASAVTAIEAEIRSMERRERIPPDLLAYEAMMRDPQFFSGATPEQQRVIAGALIQWVLVGPGGKPLQPVLRSS